MRSKLPVLRQNSGGQKFLRLRTMPGDFAADRRVSIEDKEMRHGRKSKSKRFNGFKRHIATDVDRGRNG